MLFVKNSSLDPWFNIAAEEYLLKQFEQEIIMIWRSESSIIVGKHQNTLAEINAEYVIKHEIPVVRRLSGGGTVFHDPGNINFTFIKSIDKDNLVNFRMHTEPVIAFLQSLGVDAQFEGKNDLRVNGLKISGNAEHIHKKKVLHHGTLLFDSDLNNLYEAIKAKEQNFESKAVKSIRSTVTNISSFLKTPMTHEGFQKSFENFFLEIYPNLQRYDLSAGDISAINELKENKYKQWEWNFGWSPVYRFKNHIRLHGKNIAVELKVSKGIIEDAVVSVDEKKLNDNDPITVGLKDLPHKPEEIAKLLAEVDFFGFNGLADPWELLRLFF
ncbi:MAG: lipoate--protein ligase [Bacteroidetes bacterium]|nr:MAG: lipoate--protein ligase [Bacteroidota bacterium]